MKGHTGFFLLAICCSSLCKAQQNIKGCPTDEQFAPCRCQDGTDIDCSDVRSVEELVNSLSVEFPEPAEFSQVVIQGSSLTYLPAGVFSSIKSRVFKIQDNANLSYVDEYAFGGSDDYIRQLSMDNNNIQETDIFAAISKMKGLVAAILNDNSLTSVPERALVDMPDLVHVNLNNNRISRLGREAFANCPKLNSVILGDNELRILPGRLLAIDTPVISLDRVTLVLANNQIDEIEPDALDGNEKRMEIVFANNRFQVLPKNIFKPVLDGMLKREGSSILLFYGNPFVCDCRMRWVLDNSDYFKILKSVICLDTDKPLSSYSWEELGQCPN